MKENLNDKIKHVVVLMFENRSFDHILGDMPGVNGLFDNNGNLKEEIYNWTDPVTPSGIQQFPFPISPGILEQEYIPVDGNPSFNHDFTAMLTDLYGPNTTAVIDGQPQGNPTKTYPSTNSGFVNQNDFQTGGSSQFSVMSYFKWTSMKAFHTLASEFVVCDNWFCDMPGHTAPNRAFMHCATTGTLGIDDNDAVGGPNMVFRETIFEKLEAMGQTWKMYWPGSNLDTDWLNTNVANQRWTGSDPNQTNCTGVPLAQFCADVENSNLPFYSFIMCWNDLSTGDTSMHPQTPVEAGENLLAGVYNVLRSSPHWEDTLLVVNFDENGGMYDHVSPPGTTPPYPGAAPDYWPPNTEEYSFDYSILGVRIPVLLISPWLNNGIDSTELQNTSVLRYLQDLASPVQAVPPVSFLTQRDRFANSMQLVFDIYGRDSVRQDCIPSLETYKGYTYDEGICIPIIATDEQLAVPPISYLEKITKEYIGGLPGHADSGKPITRSFATVGEMRAYVEERRNAAKVYHKSGTGK